MSVCAHDCSNRNAALERNMILRILCFGSVVLIFVCSMDSWVAVDPKSSSVMLYLGTFAVFVHVNGCYHEGKFLKSSIRDAPLYCAWSLAGVAKHINMKYMFSKHMARPVSSVI